MRAKSTFDSCPLGRKTGPDVFRSCSEKFCERRENCQDISNEESSYPTQYWRCLPLILQPTCWNVHAARGLPFGQGLRSMGNNNLDLLCPPICAIALQERDPRIPIYLSQWLHSHGRWSRYRQDFRIQPKEETVSLFPHCPAFDRTFNAYLGFIRLLSLGVNSNQGRNQLRFVDSFELFCFPMVIPVLARSSYAFGVFLKLPALMIKETIINH